MGWKKTTAMLFCQVLAILCFAAPAFAEITAGDVSHDFATAQSVASTAKDHGAGNAIFVLCATDNEANSGIISGVTNTAGDTFVPQATAKRSGDGAIRVEIWYVFSSIGNATDQVTCTWDGGFNALLVIITLEVSYTGTLAFDVASTSTTETNATSYPVQQFSSSAAGILVFFVRAPAATITEPSTPAFTSTGGGGGYGGSYRITAGAETNITPTATGDMSSDWAAVAISITEDGGGGGGTGFTTPRGIVRP